MINKLLALFKKPSPKNDRVQEPKVIPRKKIEPTRIGELGEHKINIQLDQLAKECKYLSDLLIPNPKSRSGYSQIDHMVITPYAIFVIETKNYNGEIKGGRSDKNWSVSNRFKMYNPLMQNYGHIKAIESHLGEYNNVKYISMISFTMRCRFCIDPDLRKIHSDELVVYDVELSEFIHRKITRLKTELTSPLFSSEDISLIHGKMEKINITDQRLELNMLSK